MLFITGLLVVVVGGCGAGKDDGDTSQAVKDIQQSASQGGPQPSPDLPAPAGAPSPGGSSKGGKFSLSGKTGG